MSFIISNKRVLVKESTSGLIESNPMLDPVGLGFHRIPMQNSHSIVYT